MKLLIFDKKTKQIIGKHNFWEPYFSIEDHWETFDDACHCALIVDDSVKEMVKKTILQPDDYSKKLAAPIYRDRLEVQAEVAAAIEAEKALLADKA